MTTRAFEVRNLRFATGPEVPRYWFGGARSVTRFFDGLSLFFPHGERFFMASVRAFHDRVRDDPMMRAAVRDFCAQEGIHGREHQRYNDMLSQQGLPAREMEARVERLLALVTRAAPPRWQLAATASLEHFTALLGQHLLEHPELLDEAHPTMAALWRWHALEETEHKALAYDVYLAAGGNYRERVFVMLASALIFWAKVVEHQARLMDADGDLFSIAEHARLQRYLWVSPGVLPPMWRRWLAWFRPDFHPDQLDARALIDAWRSELPAAAA